MFQCSQVLREHKPSILNYYLYSVDRASQSASGVHFHNQVENFSSLELKNLKFNNLASLKQKKKNNRKSIDNVLKTLTQFSKTLTSY